MFVGHSRMARLDLSHAPLGRPRGLPDCPGSKGIVFGMLFTAQPDRVQAATGADRETGTWSSSRDTAGVVAMPQAPTSTADPSVRRCRSSA
jgi:hypothetical protein